MSNNKKKNNMNNMNTFISKENCLLYGLPGTAILAVSLILSCKVSGDLGGSTLVSIVSFLGSNVLLWMLYLLLFQYLPLDLMRIWQSRRPASKIEETEPASVEETSLPPVKTVPPISSEEYKAHCDDFERRKQEEHQKLVDSIMDYVGRMMSPFMEMPEIDHIRGEIRAWCDDPNYIPQPAELKWTVDLNDRLKTISFKHFVWNIAVRLGFDNGYTGDIQAKFIKKLFPNELAGIEIDSLKASLSSYPDNGHIKLDRPKPTSNNVFHF